MPTLFSLTPGRGTFEFRSPSPFPKGEGLGMRVRGVAGKVVSN